MTAPIYPFSSLIGTDIKTYQSSSRRAFLTVAFDLQTQTVATRNLSTDIVYRATVSFSKITATASYGSLSALTVANY